MKNTDVLVIGRSCTDYISVVEKFPCENTKTPLEFRIKEGGGQGSTASCCIARLGGNVVYTGKLGDDEEGRFCLERLRDFGVNTDHVEIIKNGKTPVAYLFVTKHNGNRTIIYEKNLLPKFKADEIPEDILADAKVVLLDPETTYLAEAIKSRCNAKIVYDCERWRDGITNMMKTADYFIPTDDFLDSDKLNFGSISFTDKVFRLKSLVSGKLVVTRGENGAYYLSDGKLFHVPAPKVQVKDTIGAGDNFHAAFAYAISKGFEFSNAVRFSVAVASLSCIGYGGRNGIPSFDEAMEAAEQLEVNSVFKP